MSDFFTRLAERQLSETVGVSPRLPSRFAASPIVIERPPSESPPAEPDLEIPRQTGLREQRPIERATSERDTSQRKSKPNQTVTMPSDPPGVYRIDPFDDPPFTRATEPHVVTTVQDVGATTLPPPVQSKASPVEVQNQRPRLVPKGTHKATVVDVASHVVASARSLPRTHADPRTDVRATEQLVSNDVSSDRSTRSVATESTASAPIPEAPSRPREPLVPSRRDDVAEALPRFEMPAMPLPRVTEEPSVVHVSIGRIEVRAMMEPPPAPRRPTPAKSNTMSLGEYLEKRHGSRR